MLNPLESKPVSAALHAVRARLPARDVIRPVDADALIDDAVFRQAVAETATHLGRNESAVLAEAIAAAQQLNTALDPVVVSALRSIGDKLLSAYDVIADESGLARLRDLDRRHSLVWLPSHRSQLDIWLMNAVLTARGFSPTFWFGGANMSFFPLGPLGRRTGVIFIPRKVADDPVYRLVLRSYVGQLARDRVNLAWSIEGGRTRTGKLRPPRYGLLHYFVDAVSAVEGPEVLLVPVSIVYDQLHEVATTTAEASGLVKRPEDFRWLVRFAWQQRHRLGHAYLDVGEPIPLRERLAASGESPFAQTHFVERIALQVCHRINRATPVTLTAAVTLALLAGDRALTLDEVIDTIEPTARYLRQRHSPIAGGGSLTDRNAVRRTLGELRRSGVVRGHDVGTEPVWTIAPGRHLVAAFYRNTLIHLLVNRAIAEMALVTAAGCGDDPQASALRAALELRELLKFEFFFADREEFGNDIAQEMSLIDPDWATPAHRDDQSSDPARRWLEHARPHFAHLVLRPYLDAYHVFADRLAARAPDETIDTGELLDHCLRVGQQWALQRRLGDEESVSLELFRTALRLAGHRGLMAPGGPELAERRNAFAAEIARASEQLTLISEMAHTTAADAS